MKDEYFLNVEKAETLALNAGEPKLENYNKITQIRRRINWLLSLKDSRRVSGLY